MQIFVELCALELWLARKWQKRSQLERMKLFTCTEDLTPPWWAPSAVYGWWYLNTQNQNAEYTSCWYHAFLFRQIFPRKERNFTSNAICSWVFEHHETVLQWLQPPGTKSHLLEQELIKGPALLLFVPHNPLGSKPNSVLQQVNGQNGHINNKIKLAFFQC